MKAVLLLQELVVTEAPKPVPAPNELLIQVHAAGVTPTELGWYPTLHTRSGEPRRQPIPGHEFSGIVAALGDAASGFSVGDSVFGMNDWFAEGASAEFCLTQPEWMALKPADLSYAEAAAMPIGMLTAWQGLFQHARLQPGERVLVQGGAGAVGVYAVQFARSHGAEVVATASPRNFQFVLDLGAHEVIDYQSDYFSGRYDVIFDVVGGEVLEKSRHMLNSGGRIVTIASVSSGDPSFFLVQADGAQLGELCGQVRPVVDSIFPLEKTPLAYGKKLPVQGRGKVVIAVV